MYIQHHRATILSTSAPVYDYCCSWFTMGEAPKAEAAKSGPTKLAMFEVPLTAVEKMERTLDYAKDPEVYLRRKFGDKAFEKHKGMLALEVKPDRDFYGKGAHKEYFERHIAQYMGRKHGLFFLTGVQAQLTAIKIHCERAFNNRVAWHTTSHLENYEEKSYDVLYGLERTLIGDDAERLPSIEDFKKVLDLPAEKRPAVILIEVPNREIGCETYSFDELKEICDACKSAGVVVHMDGARLWEIEPYYRATFQKCRKDLVRLFDSAYFSFYKGLGGITGAMLVSDDEILIKEAKLWQRRAGGVSLTLMYEHIDSARGFNECFGTFERRWKRLAEVAEAVKEATKGYRAPSGGRIVRFNPDKPKCCQVHLHFYGYTADQLKEARDKVQEKSNVCIFDWLKTWKAVDEDQKKPIPMGEQVDHDIDGPPEKEHHSFEWVMIDATADLDTRVFVDAYVALCEELTGKSKA